jgi:hypothetical protein
MGGTSLKTNGMSKDFSWGASANQYGNVCGRVRQMRAAANASVATELKKEPLLASEPQVIR